MCTRGLQQITSEEEEGMQAEKEGDRHPSHIGPPNFSAEVAPMVTIFSHSLHNAYNL